MLKIYVASSWRNEEQPRIIALLRSWGNDVYDFRNPNGYRGFSWAEIDEDWMQWTVQEYREALDTWEAERGFLHDLSGMEESNVCVLLLPCGRSAHAEAGWMAGKGKRVIVYTRNGEEPELMYKLFGAIVCDDGELKSEIDLENGINH